MLKLASTLAIFVATVPSTLAFSSNVCAKTKMSARSSASTVMNYHPSDYDPDTYDHPSASTFTPEPEPQTYDRALDCANNFGLCNIDELLDLSEELDEYLGCYVEHGPEACENEINDRQDLAEALLVQGEMMEHNRYVQEGNVFPQDANQIIVNEQQDTSTSPHPSEWRNENEYYWGDNGPSALHP